MGDTRQASQSEQALGGPPPGTPVFVEIYADSSPGGGVAWSHKWRFQNYSEKTGTIDIPKKDRGQPGTPIQFKVNDRTEPRIGLRFVDGDDAIWVDRTTCPQSDPARDPEITRIAPSGTVLRVLDLNDDECTLHYNLRFEPDPNRYYYDPEIRNGGTTVT